MEVKNVPRQDIILTLIAYFFALWPSRERVLACMSTDLLLTLNKEECNSDKVKIIRWGSINYSLTQVAETIRETTAGPLMTVTTTEQPLHSWTTQTQMKTNTKQVRQTNKNRKIHKKNHRFNKCQTTSRNSVIITNVSKQTKRWVSVHCCEPLSLFKNKQ